MTAARLLYIRRWSSGFTEWMDFEWQVCVWSWWPQASFPFTVFLFVSICEIEKLKASCEAFPVSWCVHELTDIVLLLFLRVKLRVLARTKSDSASTIFAVLLRNRCLHKASVNTSQSKHTCCSHIYTCLHTAFREYTDIYHRENKGCPSFTCYLVVGGSTLDRDFQTFLSQSPWGIPRTAEGHTEISAACLWSAP